MALAMLQLTEGTSDKFYEVTVAGLQVITRYGRRGTSGVTQVKEYPTAEAAMAEAVKVVAAKRKGGYADGDDGAGSASIAPTPAPAKPLAGSKRKGDDAEADAPAAKKPATKAAAKKAAQVAEEAADEDEEVTEKPKKKPASKATAAKPKEAAPKKPAAAKAAAPAPAPVAAPSGDSVHLATLQLTEGTSDKFYEVTVAGLQVITRYGRRGTSGVTQVKEYPTAEAAMAEAVKAVAAKRKGGYADGDDGAAS